MRNGTLPPWKGKHGLPVGSPPEHRSATVEGQIARVADIIAYVNHDIDDAVRAGVLRLGGSAGGAGRHPDRACRSALGG